MDKIMMLVKWGTENYKKVLTLMVSLLTAFLIVLIFIPGDQGESKIQSLIDFLNTFLK
jgi:hypothetical protein